MEIEGSTRVSRAQSAAAKAEGEAAKRIELARQRVREAEIQSQQELERQRDTYEKRSEMERARQENALDTQKFQGYERVRATQQTYSAETAAAKRTGDKQLGDTKVYYDTSVQQAAADGEKKLRQTVVQNYQEQENQRRQHADQLDTLNRDYQQQKLAVQTDPDAQIAMLMKKTQEERARLHEQTDQAISSSTDHYEEIYRGTVDHQQQAMNDVARRANQELDELRASTAHRLDAYESRQSDPFYKLVNLNADVRETDDAFVLRARIPEHEQDRVHVTVQGDSLVVSGQRRNEEKLETSPGHVQSTSSFQSFSERFPIHWPVEPKGMIREFDGDTLTVRIPKKTTYGAEPFRNRREVSRAVSERPRFPKNLPGEAELHTKLAEAREASEKEAKAEATRPSRQRTPTKPLG